MRGTCIYPGYLPKHVPIKREGLYPRYVPSKPRRARPGPARSWRPRDNTPRRPPPPGAAEKNKGAYQRRGRPGGPTPETEEIMWKNVPKGVSFKATKRNNNSNRDLFFQKKTSICFEIPVFDTIALICASGGRSKTGFWACLRRKTRREQFHPPINRLCCRCPFLKGPSLKFNWNVCPGTRAWPLTLFIEEPPHLERDQARIQDFGQGGPGEFWPQWGGPEPKICSK